MSSKNGHEKKTQHFKNAVHCNGLSEKIPERYVSYMYFSIMWTAIAFDIYLVVLQSFSNTAVCTAVCGWTKLR